MRYLLGAVALAPFVLLLVAMATGRADVQPLLSAARTRAPGSPRSLRLCERCGPQRVAASRWPPWPR